MNEEIKLDRFVATFDGFFTDEYCDSVIKYYEDVCSAGFGHSRMQTEQISKSLKDDVSVFSSSHELIDGVPLKTLTKEFADIFWGTCYDFYTQQFSVVKDYEKHSIFDYKIQKTEVGGGYHVWHSEDCSRAVSNRVLVWILYLNDVEEGGETEFLYLPMRVKPKKGRLVIWPAGFTHTHRGNPPISNEKYIVTGWVEM